MSDTLLAILVIDAVICSVAGLLTGRTKGRSTEGALLGFFFGPVGLIVTLLMPEQGLRCPFCKAVISAGAEKCRHCASVLPEGWEAAAATGGRQQRSRGRVCPKCGGRVARSDDGMACTECGADVSNFRDFR